MIKKVQKLDTFKSLEIFKTLWNIARESEKSLTKYDLKVEQ